MAQVVSNENPQQPSPTLAEKRLEWLFRPRVSLGEYLMFTNWQISKPPETRNNIWLNTVPYESVRVVRFEPAHDTDAPQSQLRSGDCGYWQALANVLVSKAEEVDPELKTKWGGSTCDIMVSTRDFVELRFHYPHKLNKLLYDFTGIALRTWDHKRVFFVC